MRPEIPQVATFYRFVHLEDAEAVAERLHAAARAEGLRGTVRVAAEGVNGTLTGSRPQLDRWLASLREDPRFADIPARFSLAAAENLVFHRLKVKVRDEIVALRRTEADPSRRTGRHVDAATWHELLDDPDVLVIDVRNTYEIELGTFPGAVDPGTRSFREFPRFVDALDPVQTPRVAMFCTGGIRCEKASAYMLEAGFAEVSQLGGGILGYLEDAGAEHRFDGECFVFDQRVSVTEALDEGDHVLCHACRRALSPRDLESPLYREGVACGYCHDRSTPAQRAAFGERRRQVELASARGELHVGADMNTLARQRRGRRGAHS